MSQRQNRAPQRAAYPSKRGAQRRSIPVIPIVILVICLAAAGACVYLIRDRMAQPHNTLSAVLPTYLPRDTEAPTSAAFGDSGAVYDSENWMLMLVNNRHTLSADYVPPSFTELSNGEKIDKRIYESLQQMFDAARVQGVNPEVGMGYRTADQLATLTQERIADYVAAGFSQEEAAQAVLEVTPGSSEHQTGLAFDIRARRSGTSTDQEVYDWVAEHGAQYGFIVRYPEGKEDITGVEAQAWHIRYVGKDAADMIMTQGLCLEEYLGILN